MIRDEKHSDALQAIRALIIQAKVMASETGESPLADLLNDIELLPDYMAAEQDMTSEFRDVLAGIAEIHPCCTHALDRFDAVTIVK
jgi:hypothetical protein